MQNINAGGLMSTVFNREIEKETAKNPGVGEVMRRAFNNIQIDDFENLGAKVYTRHMSKPALEEMKKFTEGPVGGRFFRSVFAYIAESKPIDTTEVMRQFNADELTALLKFTQSDAFLEMQKKLPIINKDMEVEGEKLGEKVVKAYLKNSP